MKRWMEVLDPGPLSTIQDLGRPGHFASGVPESGALDGKALRLANRLVGNDEGCAGIETTFGGLRVRFHSSAVVAVTGAVVEVRDDVRALSSHRATYLPAGTSIRMASPTSEVHSYLAVRGGIEGYRVYGSLSTDLLCGLGSPLRRGEVVAIGPDPARSVPACDVVPMSIQDPQDVVVVRLILGPRDDWFTQRAVHELMTALWAVDARSNRIGMRLIGPQLERSILDELQSEGVVRGAVQVPADGQPIVFLNDHPVTGGYPVIAVIFDDDIEGIARARPGQAIRFVPAQAPMMPTRPQ